MNAPGRVVAGVGVGLLVLAGLTCLIVMSLQREAMEDALKEQGLRVERHIETSIEMLTGKALESLRAFGLSLTAAAAGHPAILDLIVRAPDGEIVSRYNRHRGSVSCLLSFPPGRRLDHEHPASAKMPMPVACRSLPVFVEGKHVGDVLFHAKRDWAAQSEHVERMVGKTAWRLVPVFVAFYVLLAALLVGASRAANRWRRRAATAERIEALGAIADGINHEIKNPLNTVGLSLQFLERKHEDGETRDVVASAQREAKRIRETLEDFVRFTRVSRLETQSVALCERLRERLGDRVRIEGGARAHIDEEKMQDAFAAIVDFLEQHAGRPVAIAISESADVWRFRADGRADGLDPARVERLFDPYVRGRPGDVGRGLALARAVFQAHGGDLEAQVKGNRLSLRGSAPKVPPGDKG